MKYFLLFSLLFLIITKLYEFIVLISQIKKTKEIRGYKSTFFEIYLIYKHGLSKGALISIIDFSIILSVLFSFVFIFGDTIQKVIFIICSIIISHIQMKIADMNKRVGRSILHSYPYIAKRQLVQYDYKRKVKIN